VADTKGSVRARRDQATVTFQVEGRATMVHSRPLRQFAEQCLEQGARLVRVDLRRCTFMDSTFQGTLLFLKRDIDRREDVEMALLSPSPECRKLLRRMQVYRLFSVIDADEPSYGTWTELESEADELKHPQFQRNLVQAHQELGRTSGPDSERFRKLAESMQQELDSSKSKRKATGNSTRKPKGKS
jgi:anti-anti-sigma regulatory factor